jgi:hypothetical protein
MFPSGLPNYVVAGDYLAEILADPVKKASQFDSTKSYYTLPLSLRSRDGQFFDFVFTFNPRNPVYSQLLRLLGGKVLPSGVTSPPERMIGQKFVVRIIERPSKNDASRIVNEITGVLPYTKQAVVEKEEIPDTEPLGDDDVPF